ncbi:MAG: T9SS type A sorting domain-containing protein [bacterium]
MKNIFILISLIFALTSAKVYGVKKLQWIDPYGRQPEQYHTWVMKHYYGREQTIIASVYKEITNRQNVVDILVNSGIYSEITTEINRFAQDLINNGYSVQIDTISGMSHTTLRSYLAGITGLVGAIFVGELPVAWFETNGFGNWEEFPHDLFFCDLNGIYIDSDGDGIYDNHTGDVNPEIWVGRIYCRNLTWDNEIRLLKNYFQKNHLYRVDSLSLPQRALTFIDDDWSYWTTCGLDLIYSNVVVVNDDYQTIASNYRNALLQDFEWLHLCAHSSPWGHTFLYPTGGYRGTVFNYEIFTLQPHAFFYNLFACSGTRFVEENYSAGWYLFTEPYGLVAVGSTKTGSMLYFEDFYGPIAQQNLSIGNGFKYWFTLWGNTDWDWFYGMNILGDPTLKPRGMKKEICRKESYSNFETSVLNWTPPEIIASDPESDGFPKITSNIDGRIWVVWESGRSLTNGRSDIYGAYHESGAWSTGMPIGPFYYWDYCPVIGIDINNRPVTVWAGWQDLSGNYQYDLFYSIYSGSWSSRQTVHSLDPSFDLKPSLAKDRQNRLWVAWETRRNVNSDIYACCFNGSIWSSPQQITTSIIDETNPDIVIDSLGNIWVFYLRKNSNHSEVCGSCYNGSQWLETGPISGGQKYAYHPAGATGKDGKIWVVWQANDSGNPDIWVSYFDGTNWSTPYQITTSNQEDLFPDITVDTTNTIWVVFQSKTAGDWNIFASYYKNSVWHPSEIVANLSGADINPQVMCSNTNELWVCWQSYSSGNWEIVASHQPGFAVSENNQKSEGINFYVSPTVFSEQLKIITPEPYQRIKIYDNSGVLVENLVSNSENRAEWRTAGIPMGVYFIFLESSSKSLAKKVIFYR